MNGLGKQAEKKESKDQRQGPDPRGALRTGFLKKQKSYMATLRTRWENPDYTGVIAEVPLRHAINP
jgi:hypothetical protein